MTDLHYIKSIFEIKDQNITLLDKEDKVNQKGVTAHILYGKLTYPVSQCPCCEHRHCVIKWGFKPSLIHLGQLNTKPIKLSLKKQRFMCKDCGHTFMAETPLVDKHCQLSNNLRRAIALALQDTRSMASIAYDYDISIPSVTRIQNKLAEKLKPSLHWLPIHLSLDEFKSVKSVKGKLSCIIIDNHTHRLVDILENRTQNFLRDYFLRYDLEVRRKVKTITIDMYSPYKDFLPRLFPNAIIIIDRFHIIQRLNKAIDRVRIAIMKEVRYSSPTHYTKLKNQWKLILKHDWTLDYQDYHIHRLYSGLVTEASMVQFLCAINPKLQETHLWVNRLKATIMDHDYHGFEAVLSESRKYRLNKELRKVIQTMQRYRQEIFHTMTYRLSNGPIEGCNNKIKTIKRVSYGYRSFNNFTNRIRIQFLLTYRQPVVLEDVLYHKHHQEHVA